MKSRVFFTNEALKYKKGQEIANKIKNYNIIESEDEYDNYILSGNFSYKEQKKFMFFGVKKGKFLKQYFLDKNFAGIKEEYYLSYEQNCPYNCIYCYLREYYSHGGWKFYVNIEDMFEELDKFAGNGKMISSGIVNDSLAYDQVTDISRDLIEYFRKREKIILEIRTKSTNIRQLLKTKPIENCIIAFSFNPHDLIEKYEKSTSVFDKRLEAVEKLQKHGYKIGLRFDPMIYVENYQELYSEMVDMIFSKIDRTRIENIGIGCLRYRKELKYKVYKEEKTNLFYNEMIIGIDKKERYFKPLRLRLYKNIVQNIRKYGYFDIYLGMEPDYIWEEVLK